MIKFPRFSTTTYGLILAFALILLYQLYLQFTSQAYQCPESWVIDNSLDTPTQTFTIQGQTYTQSQVDTDWIIANCLELQPQIKY